MHFLYALLYCHVKEEVRSGGGGGGGRVGGQVSLMHSDHLSSGIIRRKSDSYILTKRDCDKGNNPDH